MHNNDALVQMLEDEPTLKQAIEEYEKGFFDIPFGNSEFQNACFVLNTQESPGRKLRTIGLEMRARINALRDASFNLRKQEVDCEEIRLRIEEADKGYKIVNGEPHAVTSPPTYTEFDKRRDMIELERIEWQKKDTKKLINDRLAELRFFYEEYKKLGPMTREEFEAEEKQHFERSLLKQALGIDGAMESLLAMGKRDTVGLLLTLRGGPRLKEEVNKMGLLDSPKGKKEIAQQPTEDETPIATTKPECPHGRTFGDYYRKQTRCLRCTLATECRVNSPEEGR